MKDITTNGLGGTPKVTGPVKNDKTVKTSGLNKIGTVKMTGVYAKADIEVPRQTTFVTIPDDITARYADVADVSAYRPNADQSTAFYNTVKQEPVNDIDRASDKYLETT